MRERIGNIIMWSGLYLNVAVAVFLIVMATGTGGDLWWVIGSAPIWLPVLAGTLYWTVKRRSE